MFLAKVSPKAFEVLVNMAAPAEVDAKTYDKLSNMCEKHYKVTRTEEGERDTFRNNKQKPNQSISEYILELKKLSRYCNYGESLQGTLKETFLSGLSNKFIKSKVMGDCAGKAFDVVCEKALTVEKIFQETQVYLQSQTGATVNHVQNASSNQKCSRCNSNHDAKTCRFKNEKCHNCNKVGHISRACWGASGGRFNTRPSPHGNSRGGSTGRSRG